MGELGIAIITALSSLMLPQEATLIFAGDAMQHAKQLEVARQADGSYDYSGCFDAVAPLVTSADYAVVNLETPLADAPYSGYPMFNAPDSYAKALKDAGFDLFLTANNHTLDRHDRGIRRTIDALDLLDVDHIGTYYNAAARDTLMPFVKNVNGFRIGFMNYTYGTNGIDIQSDVVVDYIDKDRIRRDIRAAREAGAELLCVTIHWGDEYKLLPNRHQQGLAQMLVDEGVDMVIGSHPHVIQPIELRQGQQKRQLVVYSLGNFISNMNTTDTRGGAMVRVHLRRDESGRPQVESADYDLVFTIPGREGRNFKLVYADSCQAPWMMQKCQDFLRSARNVYDKHNINVNHR